MAMSAVLAMSPSDTSMNWKQQRNTNIHISNKSERYKPRSHMMLALHSILFLIIHACSLSTSSLCRNTSVYTRYDLFVKYSRQCPAVHVAYSGTLPCITYMCTTPYVLCDRGCYLMINQLDMGPLPFMLNDRACDVMINRTCPLYTHINVISVYQRDKIRFKFCPDVHCFLLRDNSTPVVGKHMMNYFPVPPCTYCEIDDSVMIYPGECDIQDVTSGSVKQSCTIIFEYCANLHCPNFELITIRPTHNASLLDNILTPARLVLIKYPFMFLRCLEADDVTYRTREKLPAVSTHRTESRTSDPQSNMPGCGQSRSHNRRHNRRGQRPLVDELHTICAARCVPSVDNKLRVNGDTALACDSGVRHSSVSMKQTCDKLISRLFYNSSEKRLGLRRTQDYPLMINADAVHHPGRSAGDVVPGYLFSDYRLFLYPYLLCGGNLYNWFYGILLISGQILYHVYLYARHRATLSLCVLLLSVNVHTSPRCASLILYMQMYTQYPRLHDGWYYSRLFDKHFEYVQLMYVRDNVLIRSISQLINSTQRTSIVTLPMCVHVLIIFVPLRLWYNCLSDCIQVMCTQGNRMKVSLCGGVFECNNTICRVTGLHMQRLMTDIYDNKSNEK